MSMKKFARTLVLSLSTAAVVLSAMPMAEAGHRDRRHHVERNNNDQVGAAIGAGIIGLALGAIIVGIVSDQAIDHNDPNQNPYRRPRPSPDRAFFPAAPAPYKASYRGSLEPWTPGWYRYCEARYRSFNPAEGTFTTYEGERRFCIAE
jgi:hypothetical protein